MLVVTRKEGQRTFIDCNGVRCEVVVVMIDGDKIRLGFEAPQEVKILRDDAYTQQPCLRRTK